MTHLPVCKGHLPLPCDRSHGPLPGIGLIPQASGCSGDREDVFDIKLYYMLPTKTVIVESNSDLGVAQTGD